MREEPSGGVSDTFTDLAKRYRFSPAFQPHNILPIQVDIYIPYQGTYELRDREL